MTPPAVGCPICMIHAVRRRRQKRPERMRAQCWADSESGHAAATRHAVCRDPADSEGPGSFDPAFLPPASRNLRGAESLPSHLTVTSRLLFQQVVARST